jgi:hypothetical protein
MRAMHKDPKFWALMVAIWLGLYLALLNIASKINLFMRLAG